MRGGLVTAALLAFDTSTEALAAALQVGGRLWSVNGEGGAAASARLLPQLRQRIEDGDVAWTQLEAIAFGHGPGAFTGLRTACAVAQGLAFGAGLPLCPLDSLLIVAEGVRAEHAPASDEIDVVMDARMGEVYAGRYAWAGCEWQPRLAPALYTLDGLHAWWAGAPPRCVAGSALAAFGAQLQVGPARRIEAEFDRAAALMRLAQMQWRRAGGIDPADALPLYLRDKVAMTVAERAALRAAEEAR